MIGLKRGTVKLVTDNQNWAKDFEKEKTLLLKTFGEIILGIEHVGSTAIRNIKAKPIIDMCIGVKSLEVIENMNEKFEKLDYFRREHKEGVLFIKGPEEKRTHYAHITVFGDDNWKNYLLFRDYLNKNSYWAKEYLKIKEKLAKKYANNREMYTKNKQEFINGILKKAKKIKY
jgi:GrpB-like predicted nucleotidyltransferase (UPF0157 family)